VLKYIGHHLSGDLSLDRLADFSGYSGFYLHRLMKQELGEPLGNYIKRKRIESAAMLLGLTSYPASQIKEMVGYTNDSAFSKAFHQVMGCSPREFRKQNFFHHTYARLPKEYVSLHYRIVRMEPLQALAFPAIADYFDKSLFKSWLPAQSFLDNASIPSNGLHFWGVAHECPNLTGKTDCRYDAAITPASGTIPKEVFNTLYPGGRFAIFTFCAPYSYMKDISLYISDYILTDTKLKFREGSSYFKYPQNPLTLSPDYQLTEWYIPVQ
jgi:AraC-like DNA-binding protein/DNA gyrase inhibitor GyrI